MDNELKEMFQIIIDRIGEQDNKFKLIENQITDVKLTIENEVTQRINALFDGYKLTHEKQWELEHRLEKIERKLGMVI